MGPNPVRKGNLDTDTHAGMTEEKTEGKTAICKLRREAWNRSCCHGPGGTDSEGDTLTLDFQPPEL